MKASHPDIAAIARMIGEPARAAMLSALLGGQWLTAGELARCARIAPPTASGHLRRLAGAGLLIERHAGRHRYFALAGPEVAAVLESLARFAARSPADRASLTSKDAALRYARTCYDHLAGRLGVALADACRERGLVAGGAMEVTPRGQDELSGLGVDVASLRATRRPLTRACLDWSERRDHLAGAVGAALLAALLERGWIVRLDGTRAVRLTLRGREGLYRALRVEIGEPPALVERVAGSR